MSADQKRLQYVDAVKGIAVIWIVFYHLLAPCAVSSVVNHLMELFLTSFFFFSGYFYRPGKRSISENIKKRTKSMMQPFLRYSLPFWTIGSVYLIATKNETLKEAVLCLRNFLAGCIWNRVIQDWFNWEYYSLGKRYPFLADFWFLIAMLFASILFFLLADLALRSGTSMLMTVIGLFAVTGLCQHFAVILPYNMQLAPYWAAFMILGAFAGPQDMIEIPSLTGANRTVIGVILLAAGIIIVMLKEPSYNLFRGSFGENEVISMLLCIAAAVSFIWGIGILFAQMEQSGLRINKIAWAGSHSLFIYLFHVFFAWILCMITGFPLRYEEPVSSGIIAGSILLIAASLVLCILRAILDDRLKK